MTEAKRNGQLVMSYRYNGKGEQIQRFIGQSSTNSLFDEQGHWLGDYDNAGKPKQQAIWLGDLPVAVVGSNSPVGTAASMDQTLAYIETDHLNTPRVAINPERNVAIWRWDIQADLVTVNRTKTPTTTVITVSRSLLHPAQFRVFQPPVLVSPLRGCSDADIFLATNLLNWRADIGLFECGIDLAFAETVLRQDFD